MKKYVKPSVLVRSVSVNCQMHKFSNAKNQPFQQGQGVVDVHEVETESDIWGTVAE